MTATPTNGQSPIRDSRATMMHGALSTPTSATNTSLERRELEPYEKRRNPQRQHAARIVPARAGRAGKTGAGSGKTRHHNDTGGRAGYRGDPCGGVRAETETSVVAFSLARWLHCQY